MAQTFTHNLLHPRHCLILPGLVWGCCGFSFNFLTRFYIFWALALEKYPDPF